jgi:hypothetical protein
MQAGTAKKEKGRQTKENTKDHPTSCPGVGSIGFRAASLFLCFSRAAATAAVARLRIRN